MNKEMIKNYEGFYCGTINIDKAWAIFVHASRSIEPLLRWKGSHASETYSDQFYMCFYRLKSEAEKAGKSINDVDAFHGTIDPIYQTVKTLLIEWKDGHNQVCEYNPILTSKAMQY